MSALNKQEGGTHYKKYKIQPVEYTVANGLGFLAGSVIKYVTRYKDKGGAEDIRKAMHYLELILEFEYPATIPTITPSQGVIANAGGPELILKLESQDPDTVGEANATS
jgi:hypothetical protein